VATLVAGNLFVVTAGNFHTM